MSIVIEKKFAVEIVYNGLTKSFHVDPEEHVTALIQMAIAAFAIIQNPHLLSLYRQDGNLILENDSVERAGIKKGDILLLRPNAVKGGSTRVNITKDILRTTFQILRDCGRGRTECAVFWSGPANSAVNVWLRSGDELAYGFLQPFGVIKPKREGTGAQSSHRSVSLDNRRYLAHRFATGIFVDCDSYVCNGRAVPQRRMDWSIARRWQMAARAVVGRDHCSCMIGIEQQNRTVLLCRDYVADELADEQICQTFNSLKINVVSDLQNLSSHSGQSTLVTLVSLLSRMGMQVGLSIPDIPMLNPQPPTSGRSVAEALIGLSNRLIPGASIRIDPEIEPDIIFALGNSRIANDKVPSWRLSGDEWRGTVASRIGHGQVPDPWAADWPIGGMVSAALAANEAFKFVMRRMPLRNKTSRPFLESSPSCSWSFDSIPLPESELDVGQVDLISAGAIIQASLYALVRLPRVQMCGRIFDDDLTAPSNLNRNLLTVEDDIGKPKVLVAVQSCYSKLRLDPIVSRFEDGKFDSLRLAQQVLVGVDDIPSRWEIQRCAPNWVAVSGTSHFNISSSAHSVDEPCSGCLHPLDDLEGLNPIPTVSFISFWAGLVMAVRLIRETLSRPYLRNRQHLWLSPLRMDLPHSAMWSPVPPARNCPARCAASRTFAEVNAKKG